MKHNSLGFFPSFFAPFTKALVQVESIGFDFRRRKNNSTSKEMEALQHALLPLFVLQMCNTLCSVMGALHLLQLSCIGQVLVKNMSFLVILSLLDLLNTRKKPFLESSE